jgi:hypothetical protein
VKLFVRSLVLTMLIVLIAVTKPTAARATDGIEYVDGKPFLNGDPYNAKAVAIAANRDVLRPLVDLVKVEPRLAGGWWNEDGTLTVQYATPGIPADLFALVPEKLVHW